MNVKTLKPQKEAYIYIYPALKRKEHLTRDLKSHKEVGIHASRGWPGGLPDIGRPDSQFRVQGLGLTAQGVGRSVCLTVWGLGFRV